MPNIIFLVHASTIMHRKFSTRERTFNGPIFRSSLIDILNRRWQKQKAKMCVIFPTVQVAILDRFFTDGAAYCMGSLNKDCWYIYTLNPLDR